MAQAAMPHSSISFRELSTARPAIGRIVLRPIFRPSSFRATLYGLYRLPIVVFLKIFVAFIYTNAYTLVRLRRFMVASMCI
jgi:hypothetical protein